MGWDRKQRGPGTGYYYVSRRVPGKPHPVKVYAGRGAAGHEAAAEAERRRRARREARALLRAERDRPDQADALAAEVREWATVMAAVWMVLTGHRKRRGEWRRGRRG